MFDQGIFEEIKALDKMLSKLPEEERVSALVQRYASARKSGQVRVHFKGEFGPHSLTRQGISNCVDQLSYGLFWTFEACIALTSDQAMEAADILTVILLQSYIGAIQE